MMTPFVTRVAKRLLLSCSVYFVTCVRAWFRLPTDVVKPVPLWTVVFSLDSKLGH